MSYFLAFAGFAALIILHEFGHFAAAKAVGMRVERFALFFPPLIAKVRRGETEYGIGAIPLGGYVRITGMNPNEDIPPEHVARAYYNQPVWKRIVVISAGPLVNVLVAFAIIWGVLAFKGNEQLSSKVDTIQRGTPAAQVLRPGDRVLAVDGRRGDPATYARLVARHRCAGRPVDGCRATTAVRLTVVRDGARQTIRVRPVYDKRIARTRVGFTWGLAYDRVNVFDAASQSVSGMWRVTKGTVSAIGRLFVSEKARKDVSGVVGSYEVTRETISTFGTVDALQVLAVISLSLAIINLFPFLPLDGGHIFWALAEKVRGRRIPFHVMEKASIVGFMLVLALFVVGLTNDIDRLRGDGFGIH